MDRMPPKAIDPLEDSPWLEPARPAEGPRPWRERLADCFRGIKLGLRGHSSFSVHFFFAVLAIAAAIVLQCQALEWCVLVGCIGLVLAAELFRSALELLVQHLEPAVRQRARPALHIAAGAGLLVSGTAVVAGLILFLPKLGALLLPQ